MKRILLALTFLAGSVASAAAACTSPATMHDFPGASFLMSLSTNVDGNCQSNVAVPSWAGGTLGAMANYGTSPGAVLVPGVNASVTTSALPTGASTAAKQPALGTAGAASVDVLTVQGIASMTPLLATATLNAETTKVIGTVRNLGNAGAIFDGATGAAVPANVLYMGASNAGNLVGLQGDATNGLWVNIKAGAGSGGTAIQDKAVWTVSSTNATPMAGEFTTGGATACATAQACTVAMLADRSIFTNMADWAGSALGAMANYGTSPGAVLVPGVNAFVTNSTTAIPNNADAVAVQSGAANSPVNGYNYVFNGTTWDRMRSGTTTGSALVNGAGTAGTAAGGVLTIQGVASMTKILVTPDSVALPANQSVNLAQVAGATTAVGSGVQATALRTTLATDSPGLVTLGSATAANSVPMTVGPALLGSYCMGANTGTMAAGLGAGAPIYSFRYGGANLAIVRKVVMEADDITTAFVAGAAKVDFIAARSFSASDTGGTAATLTGNNGKLRTSFATTAISDLRISSTATLTAGTRTLDAQPLATIEFSVPTSIDAGLLPTTTLFQSAVGESPFVLANNEGFVIQATVPGTGTWVASVRTCWDEVSAF